MVVSALQRRSVWTHQPSPSSASLPTSLAAVAGPVSDSFFVFLRVTSWIIHKKNRGLLESTVSQKAKTMGSALCLPMVSVGVRSGSPTSPHRQACWN